MVWSWCLSTFRSHPQKCVPAQHLTRPHQLPHPCKWESSPQQDAATALHRCGYAAITVMAGVGLALHVSHSGQRAQFYSRLKTISWFFFSFSKAISFPLAACIQPCSVKCMTQRNPEDKCFHYQCGCIAEPLFLGSLLSLLEIFVCMVCKFWWVVNACRLCFGTVLFPFWYNVYNGIQKNWGVAITECFGRDKPGKAS